MLNGNPRIEAKKRRKHMSDEGSIMNNGMVLSEKDVMYIVSFYPSQTSKESTETLINRLLLKEVLNE